MSIQFDALQLKAIEARDGYFLVLAPPGCGKTEILAERIAKAIDSGTDPSQMLCLTFTNRASRSMRDRVCTRLGDPAKAKEIFIGNLHRYCSHYLFENEAVAENSYIIDDDDSTELISSFAPGLTTSRNGTVNKNAVKYILDLASYIDQRRMGHPAEVLPQGPGFLDKRSGSFMRHDFDYFYRIAEAYGFLASAVPTEHEALITALAYSEYKRAHSALDFADLLILAYTHLVAHPEHRRYSWLQIDEVQDLNRLQLAIADLLTGPGGTAMYLGDEQQAIFSFMGAKLSNLDLLRRRCEGNILTLESNYRSPSYLLEVCNTYASAVLGVADELLPKATSVQSHEPLDLILTESDDEDAEAGRIKGMVRHYLGLDPDGKERLAILVSRNAQADSISDSLTRAGIDNFKISGTDMFRSRPYKTLTALYSVLVNDFDMGAWTRVLYGFGCIRTQIEAREFVHNLRKVMLTPSDLIAPAPFLEQFHDIYASGEAVVFDTETSGLNVSEDDIVQIAAFKIRNGKKVEGSDFNIILHTDCDLPEMLGDIPNPLIAEYASRPHVPRAEGLRQFLEYAGTLPLIGHNITYDYLILRSNCARDLHEDVTFDTFDTLRLAKLVEPSLRKYTLASLVDALGLQGENAHLADADIEATLSLIDYCMARADLALPALRLYLKNPAVALVASRLGAIAPVISNIRSYFHLPVSATQRTIADELAFTCRLLTEQGLIDEIGPKFDVFLRYVESEWVDRSSSASLFDQVAEHIYDLTSTINEGDLVNSDSIISDRVFIMTIHKAKGLQFENVVVLGANDGTFPFYENTRTLSDVHATPEMKRQAAEGRKEDARKLYVAISRSRRRLCVSYTKFRVFGKRAGMSPFIAPIKDLFFFGCKKSS